MKPLLTALTLIGASVFIGGSAPAAPAERPNIVYFIVDDMGYADAGFNGSKEIKTPNLDALAKQGAVLDAFYVQPSCSPTRAALLTGRYPTHTGVFTIFGPKDEAIGQVIAALEKKGILQNTLIIFSSDNGGVAVGKYTDNTPLRAGKGSIYEGGVRVCAFATWPGKIPAGIHIKEPIHCVDWYPTLVQLAGGSLDQNLPLDGKDIWPVLTQGAKSPHDALLLAGPTPKTLAVRMGDWKLLQNASDDDAEDGGKKVKATGKVELYNLADDLSEKHDLAASRPEKVKELRARLDAFVKDAGAEAPVHSKRSKGRKPQTTPAPGSKP